MVGPHMGCNARIGRNMPEPESELPPPTPLTGSRRSDPPGKVLSPADGAPSGPLQRPAHEDGKVIVVLEEDYAAFDDLESSPTGFQRKARQPATGVATGVTAPRAAA
jgi:hypothetical protein